MCRAISSTRGISLIKFTYDGSNISKHDLESYYKVVRKNVGDPNFALAVATTFVEAYDAATILLEMRGGDYMIVPPDGKK